MAAYQLNIVANNTTKFEIGATVSRGVAFTRCSYSVA